MKITGPGGAPPPPDAAPVERGKTPDQEEAFARRLEGAAGTPEAAATAPAQMVAPEAVRAVVADLRAGRITATEAVSRLVDDTVARRVGAHAPIAVRERLRAALVDLLAADPYLANLVRRMERGR